MPSDEVIDRQARRARQRRVGRALASMDADTDDDAWLEMSLNAIDP